MITSASSASPTQSSPFPEEAPRKVAHYPELDYSFLCGQSICVFFPAKRQQVPPQGSNDIKAFLPPVAHSCPIVRPQLIIPFYRAATGDSHAWAFLRALEWDTMNSHLLLPD